MKTLITDDLTSLNHPYTLCGHDAGHFCQATGRIGLLGKHIRMKAEGSEEGGAPAGAPPEQTGNPGSGSGDLPFPDVPSRNPIDLLRVPCTVHRVIVQGNKRTKRALIDAELASAVAATTHENLAVELAMATERLDQLDIFKAAECSVDVCSAPGAPDNALDVVLNVEEKGTHTISTGTYMQGGEGNAEVM